MIGKLKRKFILLSMTALFVLLAVIIGGMNLINYNQVVREADSVLELLAQNKGAFPGRPGDKLPPGFSPELPFEARYFTVTYMAEGIKVDVSRIAAVDQAAAVRMAETVTGEKGFLGQYRYLVSRDIAGRRVTFLDWGRKLDAFYSFCTTSVLIALLGYGVVFLAIFILSGRIIKPISESYEKQKRFITDAGHELKTPLTIINANADILEMELGEDNESIADIKSQTRRLKILTEQLVALSRMEEGESPAVAIAFPLSEVVAEEVRPFACVADREEKRLACQIEPLLTVKGEDKAIRQLVCILMDNAIKYTPAGGKIAVILAKQGHSAVLTVENTTAIPVAEAQLAYVFDRFYRTDGSRNSQTGGHGIGLSIAKAIVTAHGGKIKAATKDGSAFVVTATFPL